MKKEIKFIFFIGYGGTVIMIHTHVIDIERLGRTPNCHAWGKTIIQWYGQYMLENKEEFEKINKIWQNKIM